MLIEIKNHKPKQVSKKAKDEDILNNIRKYRQQFKLKEQIKLGSNTERRTNDDVNINVHHINNDFYQTPGFANVNNYINTNYLNTETLPTSPSQRLTRKDVPTMSQKEILPFNKYKEILIRRTQEAEYMSPTNRDNSGYKDNKDDIPKIAVKKSKYGLNKDNKDKALEYNILENKLISSKNDNSIPLVSPHAYYYNYKKKKNTAKSPEHTGPNTERERNMHTTIGFICKDEDIVCEDFKTEMEKIYVEKLRAEQQRIIQEDEENQKKLMIEKARRELQEIRDREESGIKEKNKENTSEDEAVENNRDCKITGRSKSAKRKYNYIKHLKLDEITKKYEKFNIEELSYRVVREYSNIKLKEQQTFMKRMDFDVEKRHAKDKRVDEMIREQQVKIQEESRVKTFNRLIDDSNRRIENQLHPKEYKEVNINEMNKSSSRTNTNAITGSNTNRNCGMNDKETKKKYKKEEWKEIYTSRYYFSYYI